MRGKAVKEMSMIVRSGKMSRLAIAAVAGIVTLFINDNLSLIQQSALVTQADARVGRPLTPVSVAGVARRTHRRAVRRDVVTGGAALGAATYYGAGHSSD